MKNLGAIVLAVLTLGVFYVVVYSDGNAEETKQGTPIELSSKHDTLDIRIENSDTTINPVDQEYLEVLIDGRATLFVTEDRNELIVEVKQRWYERFGFNAKPNVTINVPESFHQQVSLSMGAGNLVYNGEQMSLQELSLNIGSGEMELKNIRTETLEYDGSSGDLKATNVKTKSSTFDISSGNVLVEGFEGELSGNVSSGELEVSISDLIGDIDLDVSSGDVTVSLPSNADFTLDGKYSSGEIYINKSITELVDKDGVISGVSGSGKHDIKVSVSSGSVQVN